MTKYSDYDVKWPSIGGGAIVFQHGSELVLLLDAKTEAAASGEESRFPAIGPPCARKSWTPAGF